MKRRSLSLIERVELLEQEVLKESESVPYTKGSIKALVSMMRSKWGVHSVNAYVHNIMRSNYAREFIRAFALELEHNNISEPFWLQYISINSLSNLPVSASIIKWKNRDYKYLGTVFTNLTEDKYKEMLNSILEEIAIESLENGETSKELEKYYLDTFSKRFMDELKRINFSVKNVKLNIPVIKRYINIGKKYALNSSDPEFAEKQSKEMWKRCLDSTE